MRDAINILNSSIFLFQKRKNRAKGILVIESQKMLTDINHDGILKPSIMVFESQRRIVMLNRNTIIKNNDRVINEIREKTATLMRGKALVAPHMNFVLAYLAYIALKNEIDNGDDLLSFIEENLSEQRVMFVKEVVGDNFESAIQLSEMFSEDDLLAYLYVFSEEGFDRHTGVEYGTPNSLSKLALGLLDIQDDESVADFGSGLGSFITLASQEKDKTSFYGIEINSFSYEISEIRTELFANHVELELGDMFAIPSDRQFEKIFSNYPFGMKVVNHRAGTAGAEYLNHLYQNIRGIRRVTSSDWIFNALMVDHLTDSGKAVAIMTNGSTWNTLDEKIREHFIRNGYIEAVIALPEKLFDSTSISTTMIVLSKGNQSIRLVDATHLCVQGRRKNTLSDDNINHIINLLKEDGDKAKTVDFKTLKDNGFALNPSRYFNRVEIKDGVAFGSLMKRITRGAPIKASTLDKMVSEELTDTQYVMLSHIQNGMIEGELPYLKEIDPKLEKYCIGNRNLIFSKSSFPFKIAVAEVEDGKKLLGNGNLFIIDLDEEKVNPYYIQAFFNSEVGTAVLKSIVVGAVIPNISVKSLKELMIPLPSMDKQNEIAMRYQAKQDEIKVLQYKMKKAQNDLRDIFEEVD